MKMCFFILFCVSFSGFAWSVELPKNIQQWILWETHSNGAGNRSAEEIAIKHFEIPLSKLEAAIGKNLEPNLLKSLIFEKNGESYVRWIINPEDTEWAGDLGAHLRKLEIDSTMHFYFKGYLTASRSLVIYDPEMKTYFSAKVSTNKTGGKWQNKKLNSKQAEQTSYVNKEMNNLEKRVNFTNASFMHEPLAFSMAEIDQGMVIRSLEIFALNPNKYYLPGFSAVHEDTGAKIAKLNGSDNPAEFWMKHGVGPLAKANAEFVALTGRAPEAGHWQNHLIELDENFKPTGKIIFRDFADADIFKNVQEHFTDTTSLAWWPENHVKETLTIQAGPLRGNKAPEWLPWESEKTLSMQNWLDRYFEIFHQEFSKITGIPLDEIAPKVINDSFNVTRLMDYSNPQTPGWKNYYQFAECLQGLSHTRSGVTCPDHFKKQAIKFTQAKCNGLFQ